MDGGRLRPTAPLMWLGIRILLLPDAYFLVKADGAWMVLRWRSFTYQLLGIKVVERREGRSHQILAFIQNFGHLVDHVVGHIRVREHNLRICKIGSGFEHSRPIGP